MEVLFKLESARVKSVDFHPSQPWLLLGKIDGLVEVLNVETKVIVRTIQVSDKPVRVAKFVARNNWIVTGSDDCKVRVYSSDTFESVKQFDAHKDFIRSMAVHSELPLLFTCGDDKAVRTWNWDKEWSMVNEVADFGHYVMKVALGNSLSTASLDGSVRVLNVSDLTEIAKFEGRQKGSNCVSFVKSGDKTLLFSGGDDKEIQIHDLETLELVQVLAGHLHSVTDIIELTDGSVVSASEDGTVNIWSMSENKYTLMKSLSMDMGRLWTLDYSTALKFLAVGSDSGVAVVLV